MVPTKERETPKVPGFKSDLKDLNPKLAALVGRSKASASLEASPSVSNERPPFLRHKGRPSEWTLQEDERLLTERARGGSWLSIGKVFVPAKAPNVVRDRYERLQSAPDAKRFQDMRDRIEAEERLKKAKIMQYETRKPNEGLQKKIQEADDWDDGRFERLARTYMMQRKQIWSSFAASMGESWEVVEAKVCKYSPLPSKGMNAYIK